MALRQYPMMNISVDDDKIILKKKINIGMATALSDGNLIVPVIKNADQLNLVGMAKSVNDLANRARNNNLNPDDVAGGTYTITNVGGFWKYYGYAYYQSTTGWYIGFWSYQKNAKCHRN